MEEIPCTVYEQMINQSCVSIPLHDANLQYMRSSTSSVPLSQLMPSKRYLIVLLPTSSSQRFLSALDLLHLGINQRFRCDRRSNFLSKILQLDLRALFNRSWQPSVRNGFPDRVAKGR